MHVRLHLIGSIDRGLDVVAQRCNDVVWSVARMTEWSHCGSLINQNKSQAGGKSISGSYWEEAFSIAYLDWLIISDQYILMRCWVFLSFAAICYCFFSLAVPQASFQPVKMKQLMRWFRPASCSSMQIESDWVGHMGHKPVFIFALLIETSDEAERCF